MKGIVFTYLFCFFFAASLWGQEADSLKIKKMVNTVAEVYRSKKDTAIQLINRAEQLLKTLKLKNKDSRIKMEMELYDFAATVYHEGGNLKEALKYYELLLERTKIVKDTIGTAGVLYGMGMLHTSEGNIPLAIECHSQALKAYELKKDTHNVALQLYSLGMIYGGQKDSLHETEYLKKSLEFFQTLNDQWGIALLQGAFGYLYRDHHNYNLALKFFKRNLDIYSASHMPDGSTGDPWGIGNSLDAMASVYKKMNKPDSALSYYSRALKIRQKVGYKTGITITMSAMSELFYKTGELKKAEIYGLNSLAIAREIGSPQQINWASRNLYLVYKKTKNYGKAFEMFEVMIQMKDSIQNEKNKKAIYKQQLNYEFEKKAAVAKADEERKDAIAAEEKHKQQIIIYAVTGGLFLVFLLVIFVFRGYRQKQKANIEIVNQKRVIEVKQKEIIDSIHYARRIQMSLMPAEKYILRKVVELRKKI